MVLLDNRVNQAKFAHEDMVLRNASACQKHEGAEHFCYFCSLILLGSLLHIDPVGPSCEQLISPKALKRQNRLNDMPKRGLQKDHSCAQ